MLFKVVCHYSGAVVLNIWRAYTQKIRIKLIQLKGKILAAILVLFSVSVPVSVQASFLFRFWFRLIIRFRSITTMKPKQFPTSAIGSVNVLPWHNFSDSGVDADIHILFHATVQVTASFVSKKIRPVLGLFHYSG